MPPSTRERGASIYIPSNRPLPSTTPLPKRYDQQIADHMVQQDRHLFANRTHSTPLTRPAMPGEVPEEVAPGDYIVVTPVGSGGMRTRQLYKAVPVGDVNHRLNLVRKDDRDYFKEKRDKSERQRLYIPGEFPCTPVAGSWTRVVQLFPGLRVRTALWPDPLWPQASEHGGAMLDYDEGVDQDLVQEYVAQIGATLNGDSIDQTPD